MLGPGTCWLCHSGSALMGAEEQDEGPRLLLSPPDTEAGIKYQSYLFHE